MCIRGHVGKALAGAAQYRIHVAAGFAIFVNGEAHWPSKCAAAGRGVMIRTHAEALPLLAPLPANIAHNVNLKIIFGEIRIIFGIMCALHRQSFNWIRHSVVIARAATKI